MNALAVVGGRLATGLLDVTADLGALDSAGFWAVVLPYDGAPVCARFDHVRPATPWRGRPWHGPPRDELDLLAGRRRLCRRSPADQIGDRRRRRLPGEPDPPAERAAAAGCVDGCPGCSARRGQPGAVQRRGAAARSWRADGVRVPRVVPGPPRPGGLVVPDQGHGGPPGQLPGQGRRRERDDRRPRPQRSGPGLRERVGRGAGVAGRRAASGAVPPRLNGARTAASGRRLARADRCHLSARLGDRSAQAGRPGGHPAAGTGRPRNLLRCRGLGGRRPRRRGTERRDPHLLGRGRPAAPGYRRRHHLGFRPGG